MTVIPCGVGIIRRGREFLIAQRCEKDTFGSLWEFPGGKKNHGETFEECIVREVREELGIDVAVQTKFMEMRKKYDQKIIWLNFYLCEYLRGEPSPIECQNVQWVDVLALRDFPFPPANEVVINRLKKDYA